MLQDGSSWRQPMRRRPALPDCTARPTGRTAQPPAACTKPFNGPCGQGALTTHMLCELWLHYCIEKYAPRAPHGEKWASLRVCAQHRLQCSTILCSERERPQDSSMSIPTHFRYSCPLFTYETVSHKLGQRQRIWRFVSNQCQQ